MNGEVVGPLALNLTSPAKAEAKNALTWLFGISPASAERFEAALSRELADLCQTIADRLSGNLGRLPAPDPAAFAALFAARISAPLHHGGTAAPKQQRGRLAHILCPRGRGRGWQTRHAFDFVHSPRRGGPAYCAGVR